MIDYIKGILAELTPTVAVIEAAGVGYAIEITLPTYSSLVGKEAEEPNTKGGELVKLFITEIIREDAHELYGFKDRIERQLFEMLMTVSGVGASTARMIMSAYSPTELRTLIATGNAKGLAQVKGLGPKTAQRIIVDLKDKVIKNKFDGLKVLANGELTKALTVKAAVFSAQAKETIEAAGGKAEWV